LHIDLWNLKRASRKGQARAVKDKERERRKRKEKKKRIARQGR
jgi:hypothetical protein